MSVYVVNEIVGTRTKSCEDSARLAGVQSLLLAMWIRYLDTQSHCVTFRQTLLCWRRNP
jgi:hypothetical protein